MASSDVLTVRLPAPVRKRLDALAKSTARSRSWLTVDAIEKYLEDNEWQLRAIEEGLEDSRRGRLVDHEEVEAWLETWGKGRSRKKAR
jgi:RHH-type transcriptional regulator, rel operon repressor / antitoxin RelB